MKTALFDYVLPEDRIALRPLPERDASRLLVVEEAEFRHGTFADFPELVPEGALVVLNDTRVQKVRLLGTKRSSGGKVELLLVERVATLSPNEEEWIALGRSSKPFRTGAIVVAGSIEAEILGREDEMRLRVRLRAHEPIAVALETHGHVPLPPYVRRADDALDRERYQTVFARHDGSSAAPTAGLHVTERTLQRLAARGVEVAFVTLHVGLGTFRPVVAEDLDDHPMHSESLTVTPALASAVARARERGSPVVAVGTTVVRALESSSDPERPGFVSPRSGETRLLIQPGYSFSVVDGLLTNFHMPKSTLLALVAAFAGQERMARAYEAALASGYRFLSYGDAMWIPRRLP